MTDTKTFIPEQLYVTLKRERRNAENLLGFMSPFGKDAAFKKRQKTQLQWAYQQLSKHSTYGYQSWWSENYCNSGKRLSFIEAENGELEFVEWVEDESLPKVVIPENYRTHRKDVPEFVTNCSLQLVAVNHELAPRIIDNQPQVGFQFTKEVRRTYWGGGNVVWRVLDPRGFELEISSANLARIIDCSEIKQGEIMEPCVWGRSGAQNVLLPISSDIYQAAKDRANIADMAKTLSLKDIQLGDIVRIANANVADSAEDLEYLGKYTFIEANYEYAYVGRQLSHRGINLTENTPERYAFKKQDGSFAFISTPKVYQVIKRIDQPRSKQEIVVELNSYISSTDVKGIVNHWSGRIIGCCIGKLKDINLLYTPVKATEHEVYFKAKASLFAAVNGATYMVVQHDRYGLKVTQVLFEQNKISYVTESKVNPDRYYGNNYYERPKLYSFDELKDLPWCHLVLDINGEKVPAPLKEINRIHSN